MRAEVSLQQCRSPEDSLPASPHGPSSPPWAPGPPSLPRMCASCVPASVHAPPHACNASSSVTTAQLLPQASTSRSRPPTRTDARFALCGSPPGGLFSPTEALWPGWWGRRRRLTWAAGQLPRLSPAQHVGPKTLCRLGAGRRGLIPPPWTSSGIATAASAVTPPPSHVTWSLLHSGDKWPSAQPLSISRAQSPPGLAVHQLPSLCPRKHGRLAGPPSSGSIWEHCRKGALALVTRPGLGGLPCPH